ncbi:MAG: ABC transporter substrate-binding protein [Candidatus Tectomicrobia bacterium]|nr:ABC transporter substrate-binding protein [Candidatus Tectomicrobia bacterium]
MHTRKQGHLFWGVVALVVLAMPSAARAELAGQEVKIGALVPLTGVLSYFGQQQRIALEIATEEINAAGGIGGKPVRFIIFDTERKESTAIQAMRRLLSEQVLAVFGPLSCRVVEAVFPISMREHVPTISNSCGAPGIYPKFRPWTFGNVSTMVAANRDIIALWVKTHNIKRIAVIYDKADDISRGYGAVVGPKLFEAHGVEILDRLTFVTSDIDFSAQITRVKSLGVDGLVIGALAVPAAHVVREARKQGLAIPILGNRPVTGYNFIQLAGRDAEGVWAPAEFWPENPEPRVRAFTEKFLQRNPLKNPPHQVTAASYDSTYITKMIIEQNGVTNKPEELARDREKIRQGWAALKDYRGVMGITSLTETGEALKEHYMLSVKDGKWVLVR